MDDIYYMGCTYFPLASLLDVTDIAHDLVYL